MSKTKKMTLNEFDSYVKKGILKEIGTFHDPISTRFQGNNKIDLSLTKTQLMDLKEALLCAEVKRNEGYPGTGDKFKKLHIEIDEQADSQY